MRNIVHSRVAIFLALLATYPAWSLCAQAAGTSDETPAATAPPELPRYSDVRTDVEVRKVPESSLSGPRPANFYQLAGAHDRQLCERVLQAFNEPGKYSGDQDPTGWLLRNSHQIEFRRVPAAVTHYDTLTRADRFFPDLEYARVDIDADGADEHVYRIKGMLSSQWYQQLMIVPDELQSHPELLAGATQQCEKMKPSQGCDHVSMKILYAFNARVPDRLPSEWAFTRQYAWSVATSDAESQRLIVRSHDQLERNVGDGDTSSFWGLYRIDATVVAASAPNNSFAPPEVLVFVPEQHRTGTLQCVLMPVAWHK